MFTSQHMNHLHFELANGVTLSGSSYTHINNGSLTKSDKTFTGLRLAITTTTPMVSILLTIFMWGMNLEI